MKAGKDLYYSNIDAVLSLMNVAKELGYSLSFREVSGMVGLDMEDIMGMEYDCVDLHFTLAQLETYAKNTDAFEKLIDGYLNKKVYIKKEEVSWEN